MKVSVVFHSVCGNTYLMAKAFEEKFKNKGQDVSLLRVEDETLKKTADVFPAAKEFLGALLEIPVATPEHLVDSDIIVMGSPTYFGNVSGQMKMFMDKTSGLWVEGKYKGKKMVAFTSVGHSEGGGDLCLQAIHTYAQHMGMFSLSVPAFLVKGLNCPAYGFIHYSGPTADARPDKEKRLIEAFVDYVLS